MKRTTTKGIQNNFLLPKKEYFSISQHFLVFEEVKAMQKSKINEGVLRNLYCKFCRFYEMHKSNYNLIKLCSCQILGLSYIYRAMHFRPQFQKHLLVKIFRPIVLIHICFITIKGSFHKVFIGYASFKKFKKFCNFMVQS